MTMRHQSFKTPSPAPALKRSHEASHQSTAEAHPPKRATLEAPTKPKFVITDTPPTNLSRFPEAESQVRQQLIPENTRDTNSLKPIEAMSNEELDESIKMRLPRKARTSAETDIGTTGPATGITPRDLAQNAQFLNLLLQQCQLLTYSLGAGTDMSLELAEMTARLEAIREDLTAVTEEMEDFLERYGLVTLDNFDVQDAPKQSGSLDDLESFVEGGFNNPMQIEDDETCTTN